MEIDFLERKYESICDKKIVCSENERKYEAINNSQKNILKIHVDGDLVTDGERCDYALNVLNEKKIYLIELKGTDKAHGYEQLLSTMKFFKDNHISCTFFPRIVVSKDSAPKIKSASEKRMDIMVRKGECEKCIVKARILSEEI